MPKKATKNDQPLLKNDTIPHKATKMCQKSNFTTKYLKEQLFKHITRHLSY